MKKKASPVLTDKEKNKADDDLNLMTRQVLTRAETRAEAEALFGATGEASRKARGQMEKLFIQTPGAETMAPLLSKTASVEKFFDQLEKTAGMTEAQRRFPELLKVAGSSRPQAAPPKKTVAVRANLSGGSA